MKVVTFGGTDKLGYDTLLELDIFGNQLSKASQVAVLLPTVLPFMVCTPARLVRTQTLSAENPTSPLQPKASLPNMVQACLSKPIPN